MSAPNPAEVAAVHRAALADAFPRIPRDELEAARLRIDTAMTLLRDALDHVGGHVGLSAQITTARTTAKTALQSVQLVLENRGRWPQ